jgi:formylmethanofuran dehydrogenase subunit D
MSETMLLIPGRSTKQGTGANAGKRSAEYLEATGTLEINSDDMARLGLRNGDRVRVRSEHGETILRCLGRKPDDLPSGLLFVAYGPPSSQLMGDDTHGSGMPDSKGIAVEIEPFQEKRGD